MFADRTGFQVGFYPSNRFRDSLLVVRGRCNGGGCVVIKHLPEQLFADEMDIVVRKAVAYRRNPVTRTILQFLRLEQLRHRRLFQASHRTLVVALPQPRYRRYAEACAPSSLFSDSATPYRIQNGPEYFDLRPV